MRVRRPRTSVRDHAQASRLSLDPLHVSGPSAPIILPFFFSSSFSLQLVSSISHRPRHDHTNADALFRSLPMHECLHSPLLSSLHHHLILLFVSSLRLGSSAFRSIPLHVSPSWCGAPRYPEFRPNTLLVQVAIPLHDNRGHLMHPEYLEQVIPPTPRRHFLPTSLFAHQPTYLTHYWSPACLSASRTNERRAHLPTDLSPRPASRSQRHHRT